MPSTPVSSINGSRSSFLSSFGVASLTLGLSLFPVLLVLPVDIDKTAHLLLLPVILCSVMMPGGRSCSRLVKGLLATLVTLAAFSTALSSFPAPALVTLSGWVLAGFGIFALHRLAATPHGVPWILRGVALGCTVGFLLVGFLIASGPPELGMPLYQHPRLFGMHMFAGAVATLILVVVRPRSARGYGVDALLAVLCWTAFFWSGSRAPALGLIAGISVWMLAANHVTRKRLIVWTPLLLVVALSFSYLIRSPIQSMGWFRAVERSVQAADINDLSSSRLVLWSKMWKQAADTPWLGLGPDGYRYLRPKLDGEQPHNFLLHWRLELGWLGMLCLVALLGLCITTGLRNRDEHYRPWATAAASGLIACTVTALLDGVFYHVLIFIPALCLAAGCLQSPVAAASISPSRTRLRCWGLGAAAITATLVLVLHSFLFYHLVRGIPPHPRAPLAQTLRFFPSTTHGLIRWIEAWRPQLPQAALEWTLWAQQTAAVPSIFHEEAARLQIDRGDLAATEAEFMAALATAHASAQPRLEQLIQLTRNARAEMLKNARPASPPAP